MTFWPLTLIAVAVLAFLGFPIWGAIRFRPHRARNVMWVEAISDRVVQQHVVQVAPTHPEIVRTERLDRHPFYLLIHIGVFAYAICIFNGATPTNNVAALGASTRFTMAACFVIGAALILIGAAMGARLGRWKFMPRVRGHLTCDVLGDDIVLPYRVGCAGMFAVFVSMFIYSSTSFQTTTGSLGGWMTAMCAAGCIVLIPMLEMRTRKFERNDATLIADAMAQLELHGDVGK
jgi:hypothetical protein